MQRTRSDRRHRRTLAIAKTARMVRHVWGERDTAVVHRLTCRFAKNRKACGKCCCNNPRHQWEQRGPWKEVREAAAADAAIKEYQGAT